MSRNRAEELYSRYLAACELEQTPDRDRMVAALGRWSDSIGIGAAAIEFVCNAVQLAAVVAAPTSLSDRWNRIVHLCASCAAGGAWNGWSRWGKGERHGQERQAYLQEGDFWSDWAIRTAGQIWYARATRDIDAGDGWDLSQLAVLAVGAAYNRETEMTPTWLGALEAFEAGAYMIWLRANTIYVATIPTVALGEWRLLHCADGPAFKWLDDIRKYCWRGVPLAEFVIERPQDISVACIDAEPNLEIRRLMIERYRLGEDMHGPAAFLRDGGAKRLDHDERYGTLWRRELQRDEPLVLLEVINSTRERDGRFKHYWLRVPPDMNSAHHAAAWTFGQSPGDYSPLVET